MPNIDERIIKAARKIIKKRPKTVIDHLIKNGFITTEQLKNVYGYNHPPRAIRDVREEGIPIETFKVKGSDGRSIGAYRFGNPDEIVNNKLGGRSVFSKAFKNSLVEIYGSRCVITGEFFDSIYLQIDHRIPYEIAGENTGDERTPEKFMLLSAPVQRQKSWSCEHCKNFLELRELTYCETCYWAFPESYNHVALQPIRQAEIIWNGEEEVKQYELINNRSKQEKKTLQLFIKEILIKYLTK
ncbi:MAG: HNH endonuclease [Anaerolineales bacterium]|jgi:hypothetical protein